MKNKQKREDVNQFQIFCEKQQELLDISSRRFQNWIEEDFVSLWINHINFDLSRRSMLGAYEYDTKNLKYGPLNTKLHINMLSPSELGEITDFYWAKGYLLNRNRNFIFDNPESIVISWKYPKKQTFEDRKTLFKFKISKLKKFYSYNRKKHTVIVASILALMDFQCYFCENSGYCLNATRQYKRSAKNEVRISKLNQKYSKEGMTQ